MLVIAQYQRCKFSNCAYRHISNENNRHEYSVLDEKTKTLEEQITKKIEELKIQTDKIKQLENNAKETVLDEKVKTLAKFVAKL